MGGIMPNHQRDAAIKRLRAAAVEAIAAGISQIVAEMLVKDWGEPARCEIVIEPMEMRPA